MHDSIGASAWKRLSQIMMRLPKHSAPMAPSLPELASFERAGQISLPMTNIPEIRERFPNALVVRRRGYWVHIDAADKFSGS
jgi:hypothetical protein